MLKLSSALRAYKETGAATGLISELKSLRADGAAVTSAHLRGLREFVKDEDKDMFDDFLAAASAEEL